MEADERKTLFKAEFHPVLKTYIFLYVLQLLVVSIIGIIVVPFWLLGLGVWVSGRYFAHLECVLTENTLEYKKGYLFRVEKTVLLDKIQDLTLKEGPLLRFFNLQMLIIETAGQSNPDGGGDAKLIGIIDAREFRRKVLAQRDIITARDEMPARIENEMQTGESQISLLKEIRDTLKRIEREFVDMGRKS
ncbi:MAG: PH domain-containing protein [Chlorobi bacterium]|nr:PH domain-containing protein [Chlorobiota bacterium]